MSTLEAVALGDFHADKLTKYWENANAMQANCFRRILNKALSRGIKNAFFLGDLAEGVRDSTGNSMRLSEDGQVQLLSLCKEFDGKMEIDIILGNHDWAQEGSHSLQIFLEMQRCKMFKTITFHDKMTTVVRKGIRCGMLPYPNITPPKDAQIAFAHYEVNGSKGDNGRQIRTEEDHRFKIPCIQGHLHTKQRVRNHYYPGTAWQTSFGENEEKGFMWFKTDGTTFKHKFIEHVKPFRLVNLHVHKREDLKQLTTDPLVLYKLFVSDDVKIPEDLLLRYPNIVNRLAFKDEAELDALENNEFKAENNKIDLDHSAILPEYLKNKGATKLQVKRGVEIVEAIAKRAMA